jgi:hypothetical protein
MTGVLKQVDFHGPDGTRRDAQFAAVACFRVEMDLHGGPVKIQGAGGTESRTGAAVYAFIGVLVDTLGKGFDLEAPVLQKADPLVKIRPQPAQFEDNDAFPPREDAGLENIENEVVLLHELTDNGLFHIVGRVMNHDFF